MSALEIMDELYFIERGYLNANHFVYRAAEPILIDTGYISDFAETGKQIIDFIETVDYYGGGRYEAQYDALLRGFLERGIIRREHGNLVTTIKP
jgi:hypothetical protein